ncbi:hypothetical protein HY634_01210, partial [Candidatus Uhrbacteria bacterium]|nr:hypothetical protein [Candidatus Uhrbacteria bacterium]
SFFADPFHPSVLSVICHELGHVGQKSAGHGKEFQAALERVAGKVAHLLLTRGAEARQIVADVAPRR